MNDFCAHLEVLLHLRRRLERLQGDVNIGLVRSRSFYFLIVIDRNIGRLQKQREQLWQKPGILVSQLDIYRIPHVHPKGGIEPLRR